MLALKEKREKEKQELIKSITKAAKTRRSRR
jgi:hypothetical protein